jgi:membrane-associated phospholipid phosphatase
MRRFAPAAVCAALAGVVYALAFHVAAVQRADLHGLERLLDLGGWRVATLASDYAGLFDPASFTVLAAAVVVFAVTAGRPRAGIAAAVAMGGAAVTTQLLKHLLAGQRPFPADHYMPPDAFPSGHATAAASLVLGLLLVCPPSRRALVALAGMAICAAAALAIVVLGMHYPSDVLAGFLVAGAWTSLVVAALPSAVAARLPQRLARPSGDVEAA